MAKTTGLGDNFYAGGYDLSGDTNSLGRIGGGPGTWDSTGIDKSAYERLGLLRDGSMEWQSYFNPAAGQAHAFLSTLPTTDVHCMYCRGTDQGNAGAALVSKQINYDATRNADGSLYFGVQALANSWGLEWGVQLTGALDTVTVTGAGVGLDVVPNVDFGLQAYLQVTAFTGTDVTITLQDSDDNVAYSNIAALTFTQVTAAHTTERKATANTANQGRYLRYNLTTTGGFTSLTFAVLVVRNTIAGVVF